MTTFTLTPNDVRALATLTNAAAKDDVAPILEAIHLTVTPTEWVAVATDRYIVAEIRGEVGDYVHTLPDAEPFTVQVRATDIADYAKRMGARSTSPVLVTVTDDGEEIELNNYDVRTTYRTVTGNYPAVDRLFPGGERTDTLPNVALDTNNLARLAKVLTPELAALSPRHRKNTALMLDFGPRNEHGKDEAILVTRHNDPNYRALLQPNKPTTP